MKTGWVTKRLGEVCEEIRERIASATIQPRQYVGTENMLKECAGIVDSESVPKEVGLVCYQKGDVLLSNIRPYLKKSWLSDREGGCSSDVIVFRPSKCVVAEYLWRVLSQDSFFDYSMLKVGGAKMPRGDRNWIKAFEFSCPESLAEQKRIVAKIDAAFEKIDKLKANAERNLANAKELFQSALNEAMRPKPGWVEKRLGEVCSKIGSGATPKGGRKSYCSSGVSLIRSMNVHDHAFKYNELAHINDSQAHELDNVEICPNDVLINITGASIARCCVVPADVLPARVNQHVSILRISDETEVVADFLCYHLISFEAKEALLKIGEAGSTRQALTKGDLESFVVSLPDLDEQKKIIDAIAAAEKSYLKLQSNYTRLIADCAEMRQAVLKEAFEGRL